MDDKDTIVFKHIANRIAEIDTRLMAISDEIDSSTLCSEVVLKAEANEHLGIRKELNTILGLMNKPQKKLSIIKYISNGIFKN